MNEGKNKFKAGDTIIFLRDKSVIRRIVEAHKSYYIWEYPDMPSGEKNLFDSRNSSDPLLSHYELKNSMKDVCLCIVKSTNEVHSIGINNGSGKYYSQEGGGSFNLQNKLNIFEYRELTWEEFKELIKVE